MRIHTLGPDLFHDVRRDALADERAPVPGHAASGGSSLGPDVDVLAALGRRRTVRAYDQRPVDDCDVHAVLDAMAATWRRNPLSVHGGLPLGMDVWLGPGRGWSRFAAGELQVLGFEDRTPGRLVGHLDQRRQPPVAVSLSVDWVDLARVGASGYVRAHVLAGLVAHIGWLTALDLGLDGGIFSGWREPVGARVVRTGAPTSRHLLSLTLGFAVPDG